MIIFRSFDIIVCIDTHQLVKQNVCSQKTDSTQGSVMELKLSIKLLISPENF